MRHKTGISFVLHVGWDAMQYEQSSSWDSFITQSDVIGMCNTASLLHISAKPDICL